MRMGIKMKALFFCCVVLCSPRMTVELFFSVDLTTTLSTVKYAAFRSRSHAIIREILSSSFQTIASFKANALKRSRIHSSQPPPTIQSLSHGKEKEKEETKFGALLLVPLPSSEIFPPFSFINRYFVLFSSAICQCYYLFFSLLLNLILGK